MLGTAGEAFVLPRNYLYLCVFIYLFLHLYPSFHKKVFQANDVQADDESS